MLVLTRSQIRDLVPMPDAIELMKIAFAELSAGRTVSPLRTVISLADRHGDSDRHASGAKQQTHRSRPLDGRTGIRFVGC